MTVTANSQINERYQRAKCLIEGFGSQTLVQNDTVFPIWIDGSNCFWYESFYRTPCGANAKKYRLVDAVAGTNQAAFDNTVFAEALSKAAGHSVEHELLPITQVSIELSPFRVLFTAFDLRWQFDNEQGVCREIPSEILPVTEVLSPNGKQVAFIRDYNLWVRDLLTGSEWALTFDGEEDFIYCAGSTVWGTKFRRLITPVAQWSPSSTHLLAVRRDKRQVKTLPTINHVPCDGQIRPQLSLTKVAYPGDEHIETWQPVAVEVATRSICEADHLPIPAGLGDYSKFFDNLLWWSADSRLAYFVDQARGDRTVQLIEFNTENGTTRTLFEETSTTHINIVPDGVTEPLHRYLPKTNELIWWSERTGWGHLYLYDLTNGELRATITYGEWCVRDVLHVDSDRRELWIQTGGRSPQRDPYYKDICLVCLDTGKITTLLASDEEIVVHSHNDANVQLAGMATRSSQPVNGVCPQGKFVVATRSRADQSPISVLLNREGNKILQIESADISHLPSNWHWPEPFKVMAADGLTDLYGLMFRPTDFSPDTRYPILNFVASLPAVSVVPKGSFHNGPGIYSRYYFYAAALSELGFIVMLLDSRGTPLRKKSFQDESYGWIPSSANNDDHVGALKQLGARYKFIDLTRVGIFGQAYHSSLQHFMERQDFYKVCVQMLVMDSRLTGAFDQETWEGLEGSSSGKCYPEDLADKLQGKILLMHYMQSAVSTAYPPAGAFRFIDALKKANKDFEMLIVPNGQPPNDPYMLRRAWDFLVRNLLDTEPPKEYNLGVN